MLAQHVQGRGKVLPVHPPPVGEATIGIELAQGVQRLARPVERHRAFCKQVDRVGAGREIRHGARRLEGHLRVAPTDREYPCQIGSVQRREPRGMTLHRVAQRLRRRKVPDIHVRVGREDERQLERGVGGGCALEVHDRPARIELREPVQAGDELLVCREGGRLAGRRRPTAEPGIEQRRERSHDALAQRFDRNQRLRQWCRDRLECPQHPAILRGRDLHLEPNAVALLVVATRDDGTRARRAPERADRGRVAQAGGLARVHRRRHHGDRGDDFDNAGLRQSLRHPIGRHEAEVVERWIAGAILHHGDRHATLVHGKGRVPQHDGCGRDAEDRDNAARRNQPAPPPAGEDTARRRAHAVAGPAERRYERLRGRKAFVRQRRDRLRHDVFHRARHARRRPTQRRARFQRRPVVDQPFVERHNRRLSREHLEQHAAQAVHVAARVGRHPEGLLGTHVSRRSDGLTRLGDRQVAGGTDRARDAEIGDHGVIRREQDVFRLDVAVDDALRVGEGERVSHVGGDVQCRFERQASFAQQPVPQ